MLLHSSGVASPRHCSLRRLRQSVASHSLTVPLCVCVVLDSRKPQLPLQLPDDVGGDSRVTGAKQTAAIAAEAEAEAEDDEDEEDEDAAMALEPTPEEVERQFERLLAAQQAASDGASQSSPGGTPAEGGMAVTSPGGRKPRPTLSVATEAGQRVYLRVQSLPHERTLTPTADEV